MERRCTTQAEKRKSDKSHTSHWLNSGSTQYSSYSSSGNEVADNSEKNSELLQAYHSPITNTQKFSYYGTSHSNEASTKSAISKGNPDLHRTTNASVQTTSPNSMSSKNVDRLRSSTHLIGLGRSTGISRVPDLELSKSPALVASILQGLASRARSLEDGKRVLVGVGEDLREGTFASEETLAEWEEILAQYRQLTMAITVSPCTAVKRLAIPAYEGAADACLLGGNLSFYLSCQTRLLQELYSEMDNSSLALSRLPEFVSYSFLYFGVFHVDRCELARLMRSVSDEILDNPRVKLGLAAVNAIQMHNGIEFVRIYKTCDIRQRTLMNPRLSSMRATALAELIRAYHVLERNVAVSLLGLSKESDLLLLLKAQSPALAEHNSVSSSEFSFRLPGARTTAAK